MITLGRGLSNSLIVLEFLRRDEEFQRDHSISVGTFTNCREEGLTFILSGMYDGDKYIPCVNDMTFTWCIYEHRNSDSIIINGKKGFVCFSGDLPYAADSKWTYLAEFKYNEHYQCADRLMELIKERAILAKDAYYKMYPKEIVK
jgi:hypothetical protein